MPPAERSSLTLPGSEPRPRPTATSFVCNRETRELGEDYPEIRRIDRAYQLLERRLSRAQPQLRSRRALSTVMDLSLALADARHDASLTPTLSLARDAFVEARVVNVARRTEPD